MQFSVRDKRSLHRLGEIFLDAGVISPDVFSLGIMMAQQGAMPIGRALVEAEEISELDLDCALDVQSAIRTKTIEAAIAKELLRFAHVHQVSIDDAYRMHGLSRRLGLLPRTAKLILAAGIVNENAIEAALKTSLERGIPIGRSLVTMRLLKESTLEACLNLQILIRDGQLSFLQAVSSLQSIHNDKLPLADALQSLGIVCDESKYPRLGELLVAAGALSLEDSLLICELGIEDDKSFGILLVERGLVPYPVVEAAIQVQSMLALPGFTKLRAVRLLNLMNTTDASLEQLAAELDSLDQVIAILLAARVIDEDSVRKSIASIKNFECSEAEAVMYSGIVNGDLFDVAVKLIGRIQRGSISFESAIDTLQQLKQSREQTIIYPRDTPIQSSTRDASYRFKRRSVRSEIGLRALSASPASKY